ncbi:MAG: hypothetical protein D6694_06780, partial [Gammaproteobacteria bacterium]
MKWFRNKHAQAASEPDGILNRIWECFCQNQDEEAAKLIQELEGLHLSDPQRCILRVYRGWLAYRKGVWEEAEQNAHWVLDQCQDRYSLGKAYQLIGACALDRYKHCEDDDEETTLRLLGTVVEACNQALVLLGSHRDALLVYIPMAMALVYQGNLEEAIVLLKHAIDKASHPSPEKGWLLATLGEIFILDKNDWEAGRPYLEEAAKILDPVSQTHAWVHVRLAEGYIQEEGNYAKARVHGRKAVELAAKDPQVQAWVRFGAHFRYALALHYGEYDYKEAERQYKKALQVAETESDAEAQRKVLAYLGNLYARQKRYRASLRVLKDALKVCGEDEPESWKLHWSLGSVLSNMGKHREGAEHYRRAIAML